MSSSVPLITLVLAAGKGTRMKSTRAKVLHEVFFVPMIHHVLQAILPLDPSRNIVVVGHQQDEVRKALNGFSGDFVTQEKQMGTGHAVLAAERILAGSQGTVMIVCGDTPLIRSATLLEMFQFHTASSATLTLLTTELENPTNYGRILISPEGRVKGIVEEKDATPEQKAIREINAGIYCVDKTFLFEALHQVGTDNSQGEVYLTDIVSLAVAAGRMVERFAAPCAQDVLGVNSRVELAAAHREIQARRNTDLMVSGVTMHSPETISISADSTIDQDTILTSSIQVHGLCRIGKSCHIEPGVILHDCILGDYVQVGAYSYLKNCTLASGTVLAPHSQQLSGEIA